MANTPEEQLGVSLPADPEPEQQAPPEPEAEAEEQRPEWLDERFKSPEELARSYTELEDKLREQGQERNALADRLSALEAQQYEPQYDPSQWYDPDMERARLAQMFDEDPVAATEEVFQRQLQAMQQAQAQQQQAAYQGQQPLIEAQQATQSEMMGNMVSQRMGERYDDWETYRPKAQEILMGRQIPQEQLLHMPSFEQHVDEAYRLAKFEALQEREQVLRDAGLDQGEIDRQMKMAAQTMSGRSAREEEISPHEQRSAEILAAHRGNQHYGTWASRNLS